MNAYINKKKLEYERKCKNEIRKLEWKEEKVYKEKKKPFNLVKFAAELLQENVRLRDSDISGNGLCISCSKFCTWKDHAAGHRWSRLIKNLLLCFTNINLQCNGCNRTTWPRGNKEAEERVNAKYDENLDKKYGKWTNTQLREIKEAYFKNDYDGNWVLWDKIVNPTEKELRKFVESQLEENELRWKWKDFYKPSQNWRKIYEKYVSENPMEE
jgi:hypothetical protein